MFALACAGKCTDHADHLSHSSSGDSDSSNGSGSGSSLLHFRGRAGQGQSRDRAGSQDSSSGTDSDSSCGEGVAAADAASWDSAAALLVDRQGRPVALWDELTLQQKFPVLSCCQQEDKLSQQASRSSRRQESGVAGSSRKSKSGSRSKKHQQHFVSGHAAETFKHLGTVAVAAADWPSFQSEATSAAAAAAYAAAAAAADVGAVQRQRDRRHQKSLVKGAWNGQLLPGEKKKLRKEKIAAKRATRAAERGLSALSLLSEIEDFAAKGQDMMVLPACGKYKQVSDVRLDSQHLCAGTAPSQYTSTEPCCSKWVI